ncbi:hypothetical protein I6E31_06415 [Fusobacterium varium]|nr:hypothetical protein [Fusobacterium varium]
MYLDLSDKIGDFLMDLKKYPEDYCIRDVIDKLDDFYDRAIELENEIEDLKDKYEVEE